MSTLSWSDSLALNQPQMDATHHEFVDLLATLDAAFDGPEKLLELALDAVVEHTEGHFAQEEHWMLGMGFAPQNCHSYQHAQVLKAMHEVLDRLRLDGDVVLARQLFDELVEWFPAHARTMDASLAQCMASMAYVPADPARMPPPAATAYAACAS
ncbi:hemerythrin [Rubrivivax gelatinosus]|uniref:Hemerythrin n=1 Tax=Rubrivivax gelatinosus TaxID=28068 RepID=A0ABS1DUQ8_RUBGE|nr:hemerythrin domain-containing protein [Rubrivivax gelatinosus]MBK1614252.1 hemerythrin [Rubrivivax gelatinosus]MBK1713458.1 hemerythrin [Rubrivivax gelatinosus]